MSAPLLRLGGPVLVLLGGAPACTLIVGDLTDCAVDGDCEAFGRDAVCRDGVCGLTGQVRESCEEVLGEAGDDALRLGAALPMTTADGAADSRGVSRRDAMRLAVEEINAREGVDGRRFSLRVCDTRGDRDLAREHADRLAGPDEGAAAILTAGTDETLAAFTGAREHGAVVMSVSATSPELTTLSDDGLLWRTAPSDVVQGRVLAALLAAVSPARVAVFEVDNVYGNGLSGVFQAAYEKEARTFLFQEGGADLPERLGEADAYDPDAALVIAGPEDAAAVVGAFADHPALADASVVLTDASRTQGFLDALDDAARVEGARGTAPAVAQTDTYRTFAERYDQRFGEGAASRSFVAHSYDAVYCLALASAWALGQEGGLDGARLAVGLSKLAMAGVGSKPLQEERFNELQASLLSGQGVDVDGASGALDFDSATGDVTGPIEVWTVADGKFVTVEVRSP